MSSRAAPLHPEGSDNHEFGADSIGQELDGLIHWRYPVLAACVGALLVVQTLNQQWSGDVWEHIAVIRELGERPFNPRNPILAASGTPHAFISPYTLTLGLLVRWTGADPVAVLAGAGIANLVVFLVALRTFVRTVIDNPLAPFWALLFVLFAWGVNPWRYSGFVGMNAIGFGLPYPSMFGLTVALLSLSALARFGVSRSSVWLAWYTAGSILVVLTHPPTTAALLIGSVAMAIRYRIPTGPQELVTVPGVGAVIVLVVVAWPGYPLFDLLLGEGNVYNSTNFVMYSSPITRIGPALLGVVVIGWRSRRQWRDPLGFMLIGVLAVYLLGWATERWTYGRVIAFGILILQIGLAGVVADLERRGRQYHRKAPWLSPALVGVVAVVVAGLTFTAPGWIRGFPLQLLPASVDSRFARTPNDVAPWQDTLGGGVVVATDPTAQEVAPAVGAKVLYSNRPLAFVHDLEERQLALTTIFADDAGPSGPIIEHYGVTHLVTLGPPPQHLASLGEVVQLTEGYWAVALLQS